MRGRGAIGSLAATAAICAVLAAPAHPAVTTTQEDLAILTIRGDGAADSITVACPGGRLKINSADPPDGPKRCDRVFALTVMSGGGGDRIDLAGFRQSEKPDAVADVRVEAGAGDDLIFRPSSYGFGQPVLGGRGDDVIAGGGQTLYETTLGGPGNDRITTGGGLIAEVSGGPGADFIGILPLAGFADVVRRTDVRGGSGRDRIRGAGGDDWIDAGPQADRIFGAGGADLLVGGKGADLIYGNRGPDRLEGGPGRDRLFGGRGRDRSLQGGRTRLEPLFPPDN